MVDPFLKIMKSINPSTKYTFLKIKMGVKISYTYCESFDFSD